MKEIILTILGLAAVGVCFVLYAILETYKEMRTNNEDSEDEL